MATYRLDIALSVFLLAILAWHVIGAAHAAAQYALIAAAFVGLAPVAWGAFSSLRAREWASMDLLASVALVFSLISGEWVSAVFIALMLAAARILDDLTRDRTEKSIRGLLKLRPDTASVERGGALFEVPIADIRVGDIVVVDIGKRVPIDGVVLSGSAAVDESSLTGESLPVDKSEGDRAMSSTLVQSGSIRIRTTHTGKDTTLERVIRLVEAAREEKPAMQTLGEKFGKVYLVSIFVGSALLYAFSRDLALVLSVVLVVCADDVAVAIPITYLRAIRAAARLGVVVKGSRHFELLGKIETVVFDKTGTLTMGALAVSGVSAADGVHEADVLRMAALAAVRSTHPVSRAIVARADESGMEKAFPDSAVETGGKGISVKRGSDTIVLGKASYVHESGAVFPDELLRAAEERSAEGNSISYVALNGKAIGLVAASDRMKANAAEAIAALRELGIKHVAMLTGDNERAAQAVARAIGADEWYADLLPEHKVDVIRRLQQERGPVAMVGDGVNDAAALSIAGVGIAMGGLGTEGAIESAQVVLMRDDLATIPAAIRIARAARRVSFEDFWIWGATNLAGLALVFGGLIGPAGAAAYNFLSDFLPLINSLRVGSRAK